MAWTEQCKIAFKVSADAKYWRAGDKNLTRILRELSQESGIPFNTLKRWYYEKDPRENRIKNDTTENLEENQDDKSTKVIPRPICSRCNENPVALQGASKKPYSENSKYYGLCNSCRKLSIAINKGDTMAKCPHCQKQFKLSKENTFA